MRVRGLCIKERMEKVWTVVYVAYKSDYGWKKPQGCYETMAFQIVSVKRVKFLWLAFR